LAYSGTRAVAGYATLPCFAASNRSALIAHDPGSTIPATVRLDEDGGAPRAALEGAHPPEFAPPFEYIEQSRRDPQEMLAGRAE
jgi:hypothetical protein